MSIQFERLLPRFILNDKNGYALAKAIERAFELVAQAVNDGIDIIQNPERMPEWRLDEAAREYGILYDYHATIEQKRYWIANAIDLYKIYGTPQAIITFLEGMFSAVEVEVSAFNAIVGCRCDFYVSAVDSEIDSVHNAFIMTDDSEFSGMGAAALGING
jgi:hypothetical protein